MTRSHLAIEASGLAEDLRRRPRRRRRRPRRAHAAPSTACSGPTAPARRRRSGCSRRCCAPTRARRGCSATTSSREADAVRAAVSLTGQLASVDEDLTGRENLILLGRLLGLKRAGAKARADRAARGLRPRRRRRPAGQELLRRDAPPARHRGQHRRHARADVPRRADDRPRPALAQPGLGHHPRARRARARRSCSAPSTSTRPTSSPTGSR